MARWAKYRAHEVSLQVPRSANTGESKESGDRMFRAAFCRRFSRIGRAQGGEIEDGNLLADHLHIIFSIPLNCDVPNAVGDIKEKSAIHLARADGERKTNFKGQDFRSYRYFVSSLGRPKRVIRNCIHDRDRKDVRLL